MNIKRILRRVQEDQPLALEVEECITGMKFARRCKLASQNENVGVRGIPKPIRGPEGTTYRRRAQECQSRNKNTRTGKPVLPA
jgi:hypothetical protein